MADDKSTAGRKMPRGTMATRIYGVEYWTKKFGVPRSELEAAVAKVGVSADAVAGKFGKTTA